MKAKSIQNLYIGLFALCALIISIPLSEVAQMSDNWMAPYLSAAKNLRFGGKFLVNINECLHFKDLNLQEQLSYRFEVTDELTLYNHNPIGYAYLIAFAKGLFGWLVGDQFSIILLQVLTHILLCCSILFFLKKKKLAFFLFAIGYMLNPLILRYAAFNYYYFWQAVPSLFFIIMLLDNKKRTYLPLTFALLFPFIFCSRITLVAILFLFFLALFKHYKPYQVILCGLVFVLLFAFINKPTEKNPWHTVYVGIAAYTNPYVNHLSDDEAYALFEQRTGKKLHATLGGNYYDKETIQKYQQITKEEVKAIANKSPLLFLKNALLNNLQLFSFGYINHAKPILHYLSAFFGLIILLALLYFRQFILIILIAAPSIAFTFYYPPIPAYMYGSYVFLLAGYYTILENVLKRTRISFA